MPKDYNFEGSGHRGAAFEQKGFQERNLQLLLKTLSNKTVQKSVEALSQIEKDEWRSMAETTLALNSFVELGGAGKLLSSIKDTIDLKMDEYLAPLQNEINQQITDLINPLIELITPVVNDLSTFIADNAVGSGVGGIAGSIAALWLPGGVVWPIMGALLGAILQDYFTDPYGDIDDPAKRGATAIRAWGIPGNWEEIINGLIEVIEEDTNRIGGFNDVL